MNNFSIIRSLLQDMRDIETTESLDSAHIRGTLTASDGFAALERIETELDRYRETLEWLQNWKKAYPLDIFKEPDLEAAHSILTECGISLDAISAHNIRHVLSVIQCCLNEALEPRP